MCTDLVFLLKIQTLVATPKCIFRKLKKIIDDFLKVYTYSNYVVGQNKRKKMYFAEIRTLLMYTLHLT